MSKSGPAKVATTRSCLFAISLACTHDTRGGSVFECELLSDYVGMIVARFSGPNAAVLFANEAGGHRWQRVPPTERSGRRQSSTITVAVLPEATDQELDRLPESELEITTTRGGGPGGQNRNKVETCVMMRHKPTGLSVRCESERSQHANRKIAKAWLLAKINQRMAVASRSATDDLRRSQIGTGERSDKIRTVQEKNGIVVNHRTGRKIPVERYMKGDVGAISG